MIRTVFVVPLLIVLIASGAVASVTWNVQTVGDSTTYTYTYLNTDATDDLITGFHVYAPLDPALITGWDADMGWLLGVDIDPTGASDIYWYTDDPMGSGIMGGDSLNFSMTVPSYTSVVYDYVIEDFPVTNWGYDGFLCGGTWLALGSVPVPAGSVAETPEPASMLALCAGFAALIAKRKKRCAPDELNNC